MGSFRDKRSGREMDGILLALRPVGARLEGQFCGVLLLIIDPAKPQLPDPGLTQFVARLRCGDAPIWIDMINHAALGLMTV